MMKAERKIRDSRVETNVLFFPSQLPFHVHFPLHIIFHLKIYQNRRLKFLEHFFSHSSLFFCIISSKIVFVLEISISQNSENLFSHETLILLFCLHNEIFEPSSKQNQRVELKGKILAMWTKLTRERSLLCKLISFDVVSNGFAGDESIIAMGLLTSLRGVM